jgi:predicted O-linked N-acetylglucosamine transferase (SPINDLY family)
VLTWLGDSFAGRVAASLLTAVGLPELIAPDVRGYIAQAIEFATDAGALARHRQRLAATGRDSALFDTVATTRALEHAYMRMAEQTRSGARQSFRVDAVAG